MTACEVSTLPATVAAGCAGASIEPSGTLISRGVRQPLLSGMSSATRVRNTYSTAAVTTDFGALKLPGCWGEVPVKSTRTLRASRSTVSVTSITAPLSVSYRQWPSCSPSTMRRTDSSALSCTWPM